MGPSAKNILEFWHHVEFFQPYDLQELLELKAIRYQLFPKQVIDSNLPWMNPYALHLAGGDPLKTYRFRIYLGIFDKSELMRLAKQIRNPLDEKEKIDWEERLTQEGKTCFAKMTLDFRGVPEWSTLSLSTLPWTLGKIAAGKGERIRQTVYEEEVEIFEEYLQRIPLLEMKDYSVLDANGLMHLCQGLFNWAQFFPKHQALIAVELVEKKGVIKHALLPDLTTQLPISIKDLEEDEGEEREEPDIGILNSFYIKELERVLHGGVEKTPAAIYLSGSQGYRIDLESKQGGAEILNRLHPRNMTRGRWPNPEKQHLNLMQQFALNSSFGFLKEGGLYSINGPPGTGKTTLVREIVAENLVRRAEVLATFDSPQDTFIRSERFTFSGRRTAYFRHLHPLLTGYEMIVASSNNAAVENISKELPKKSMIDGKASYLESVANKIAADHDKLGQVIPLKEEEKHWGLIAVPLGNRRNCRKLLERGFILKHEGNDYQTIWEWADSYQGPSFDEAKKIFNQKLHEVNRMRAQLADFWELHRLIPHTSLEKYCQQESEAIFAAQKKRDEIQAKLAESENKRKILAEELKELSMKIDSATSLLPSWYHWQERKRASAEIKSLHQKRLEQFKQKECLENSVSSLRVELEALKISMLEAHLAEKKAAYEQMVSRYEELKLHFYDIPLPPLELTLGNAEIHHESYWQTPWLNRLRSELFSAAMSLHQAWAAAVTKRGGVFRGNLVAVSNFLSGNAPIDPSLILPVWQSLFMLIPVVSTTFASFGRLFKGVSGRAAGMVNHR